MRLLQTFRIANEDFIVEGTQKREKGSSCIQACLSFIQHESLEIVCSPEVFLFAMNIIS